MTFSPFSPVEIHIESAKEGLERLERYAEGREGVLFIGEAFLLERLGLNDFVKRLLARSRGLLYTDVRPNPDIDGVHAALRALLGRKIELIVALGGGSAMDLAKAVSVLHGAFTADTLSCENVREAIAQKQYLQTERRIDMVMLPTTAGTGSEVTKWATIWDPEKNQKLSVDCDRNFAKAALLLPEFTAAMPPSLTAATGLDALCHAMEAYWAQARTPLSQQLALSAVRQTIEALPAVQAAPDDLTCRRDMLTAALTAGLAFSITRTTACHSISYPLTMRYRIPHGFACALTLAEVARRNAAAVPEIDRLLSLFGAADGLSAFLTRATAGVHPLTLSSFGVSERDLPEIVQGTFTQGRMNNNPIVFTQDEVLEILRGCM